MSSLRSLVVVVHVLFAAALVSGLQAQASPASSAPARATSVLPDSPLRARLLVLAQGRAEASNPAKALGKAELLRPELSFKPRRRWQLLPDLARSLTTDDEERAAVLTMLETSVREARQALAAEGADNDVAAAAALCVAQLWQFARNVELSDAHTDALHAQVVVALAVPEVAAMSDADKQRFWEFSLGFPIFLAHMGALVDDETRLAGLRQVAGVGFGELLGVDPARVEIDGRGLVAGAAPATAAGPSTAPLPATGPAIPGVTYTAPPGWSRTSSNGNVVFRTTLVDVDAQGKPETNNSGSHEATIGFLPVLDAQQGPTALFDQTWRDQFAAFALGDTFVHYRGRLPSQLVALYMGRFFARPDAPLTHGNPKTYGALYLIDLGGNGFQPLVAVVHPRSTSISMDSFVEGAALRALSFPLWAVLESVRPERGAPPYPAGGFFAAGDLRGSWTTSGSAFGGHYYDTATGGHAGVAVMSSGGSFALRDNGTYDYSFAYASSHPQFGRSGGSTKHDGRYRLNGDIVLVEPSRPIAYEFTCCAVGIGVRQTAEGVRRVLVTVTARDGGFRAPSLVPNWDGYDGTMTWYTEEGTAGTGSAPAAGPLRQWATGARASSQYGDSDSSATQATGAPDVARAADDPRAWATRLSNGGEEWLEVTFAEPVHATEVRVVQSFQPGAIVRIDVIDAAGGATAVWHGPDATVYPPRTIGVLSASFQATGKPVVRVKVVLDTKRVLGWNEIDAVELVGVRR